VPRVRIKIKSQIFVYHVTHSCPPHNLAPDAYPGTLRHHKPFHQLQSTHQTRYCAGLLQQACSSSPSLTSQSRAEQADHVPRCASRHASADSSRCEEVDRPTTLLVVIPVLCALRPGDKWGPILGEGAGQLQFAIQTWQMPIYVARCRFGLPPPLSATPQHTNAPPLPQSPKQMSSILTRPAQKPFAHFECITGARSRRGALGSQHNPSMCVDMQSAKRTRVDHSLEARTRAHTTARRAKQNTPASCNYRSVVGGDLTQIGSMPQTAHPSVNTARQSAPTTHERRVAKPASGSSSAPLK
jgi:hypothetical protein